MSRKCSADPLSAKSFDGIGTAPRDIPAPKNSSVLNRFRIEGKVCGILIHSSIDEPQEYKDQQTQTPKHYIPERQDWLGRDPGEGI